MIDYSCNHTSQKSNGPTSGVKIQKFRSNLNALLLMTDKDYKEVGLEKMRSQSCDRMLDLLLAWKLSVL